MKIITEKDIDEFVKNGVIEIKKEMVITPLAREYAMRKGIKITYAKENIPLSQAIPSVNGYGVIADDKELLKFITSEVQKTLEELKEKEEKKGEPEEIELPLKSARAVVVSTGINKPGIVARITNIISECGGDIVDISQTIVSGFFTMIIIVDISGLEQKRISFMSFKKKLKDVTEEIGCEIMVMHEDILKAMHRV